MEPIRTNLQSSVDETLAKCPRFRILVVGTCGVGKSSLVKQIFNLDEKSIKISHNQAGEATIGTEYTSDMNPRFILHDSRGYEPGKPNEWATVEDFLRRRNVSISDNSTTDLQIHAIWMCIETPRRGARLLQKGDDKVLDLARELEIPLVVVFTKFDILVAGYLRNLEKSGKGTKDEWKATSKAEAQTYFNSRASTDESLHSHKCVQVSTNPKYDQNLESLTKLSETTLQLLYVQGKYTALWAMAQQVSAKQKVEASISEGFKKYWVDLGRSTIFQGRKLIECLWRIHDDILKVWNFNDPDKLLVGDDFLKEMFLLVQPMMDHSINQNTEGDVLQKTLAVAHYLSPVLGQILAGAGVGIIGVQFLYELYEKVPQNAQCLGAYIVDLTVVLHTLFMTTLATQPPRAVTRELLKDAINGYKMEAEHNHRRICLLQGPIRFETKVKDLIYEIFKY